MKIIKINYNCFSNTQQKIDFGICDLDKNKNLKKNH